MLGKAPAYNMNSNMRPTEAVKSDSRNEILNNALSGTKNLNSVDSHTHSRLSTHANLKEKKFHELTRAQKLALSLKRKQHLHKKITSNLIDEKLSPRALERAQALGLGAPLNLS